jgi:hypothetical protein
VTPSWPVQSASRAVRRGTPRGDAQQVRSALPPAVQQATQHQLEKRPAGRGAGGVWEGGAVPQHSRRLQRSHQLHEPADYDSVHRVSTQCQGALSYRPCQEIPTPLADSCQSILQAVLAASAGQGGQSCQYTPTSLERTMNKDGDPLPRNLYGQQQVLAWHRRDWNHETLG